jgi:hypothetical protein
MKNAAKKASLSVVVVVVVVVVAIDAIVVVLCHGWLFVRLFFEDGL